MSFLSERDSSYKLYSVKGVLKLASNGLTNTLYKHSLSKKINKEERVCSVFSSLFFWL